MSLSHQSPSMACGCPGQTDVPVFRDGREKRVRPSGALQGPMGSRKVKKMREKPRLQLAGRPLTWGERFRGDPEEMPIS